MIMRFDSGSHDGSCIAGFSSASLKASIAAAWAADSELDSTSIVITVLGPVVVLEGYLSAREHRDIAVRTAEAVVGAGKVQDRMLYRYTAQ